MKGNTLDEFWADRMQDPDFRKAWEELEDSPEYMLGTALAERRNDANMTQRELAKKAGVIPAQVCHIESCEGNPTLKTLKKLASALGCRLELKFTKLPREAP